ncbi:protein N-lysine methyltransferase family protein [Xanthomonas sp. AM6]|uniref:class I SAM-dependent methyltransferase n=1 Tax=Xanthomonas sp. AM6 TaxID=2982531 RepID=UPI0021DACBBD|nr:protein N-lysine methyltransferase family protein [Xanthomonas sp. AM6]UYB51013.1 protein N-lysine methyltransferase family protein [Xanthomonas sp. AM6]
MSGYATQIQTLNLGGQDYRIRSLLDTQQFSDPDALAEDAGISSAQWSLFGNVWPAGRLLAEAMAVYDVAGKRILEIGCGLGLASLVLRHRGADIVASDRHPLTEVFLAYNAALNDMPAVPYRRLDWDQPNPDLGRFDMIIGSDVLYEHQHPTMLADLLARHATPSADVLIADPGRGNSAALTRALATQGYTLSEQRELQLSPGDLPPHRGRVLRYRRDAAPTGGNA